ncbi:MAG: ATP-binding protein [Pirellulales bacterium]
MASLYVIRGKDSGRHYELLGRHTTIGREAHNQIQLHDTEISRQHARIDAAEDGRFVLMDLGSSNGSYVNSDRIRSHTLRSGDRIQLGTTLLIFSVSADASASGADRPHNVDIVRPQTNDDLSQIRRAISHSELGLPPASDLTWQGSKEGSQPRSHWELMVQVSQAITRTLDIDELLSQVLDLIFQWVRCDCGCIMLFDDVSGHLTPACRRNRKSSSDSRRLEISKTILDYVINKKEGVLTGNAQDDSRWQSAASIVSLGIREAICVPMQGRYGMHGAIYVDTSVSPMIAAERGEESFTEEHLKLLIAIGNQAALAIEDTQFYRATVQSERMAAMGQTIANLSHHVKNILQGVRGGSYLIEKGLDSQDLEIARKGWRIVEKNQERISNLVMDMLSFSKERIPELKAGDIRQTIEEVIELMQSRADEAGAKLIWEAPRQFPLVRFDAEAMHRAILNVVTNAIDAVEHNEAAEVRIDLEQNANTGLTEIRVTDNGEGIEPENLERIFSVFESKKGARGTGLGLPVSRKIMREHGGDISVSSRVGQGTCFILAWPGLSDLPSELPTMA